MQAAETFAAVSEDTRPIGHSDEVQSALARERDQLAMVLRVKPGRLAKRYAAAESAHPARRARGLVIQRHWLALEHVATCSMRLAEIE